MAKFGSSAVDVVAEGPPRFPEVTSSGVIVCRKAGTGHEEARLYRMSSVRGLIAVQDAAMRRGGRG